MYYLHFINNIQNFVNIQLLIERRCYWSIPNCHTKFVLSKYYIILITITNASRVIMRNHIK